MPGAHAILSPSSASRWLVCTPSARLEMQFADTAGEAAEEGTLAHSLGELLIRFKTNQITKQKYNTDLKTIQKNKLYNATMMDYATDYAVFVIERWNTFVSDFGSADLDLETRLDLTAYIPEGFGTGDTCLIGGRTLNFIDLKYGKGVLVEAEDNKQMKIYALGALKKYAAKYEIDTVTMTIYQPRLDNISDYTISVEELIAWGEKVLKPKAELAFAGKGDFVPGEHCRFCKAKTCKARADENLAIAKYDFQKPSLLTDDEIADILERHKELTTWASDIAEYALSEALTGKTWPGFKVVAGKSNRYIADETTLDLDLALMGLPEDKYKITKLRPLGELEELVGKKRFAELFGTLIAKPNGAPTLVPLSDKRQPRGLAQAKADFAEPCDLGGVSMQSAASIIAPLGARIAQAWKDAGLFDDLDELM